MKKVVILPGWLTLTFEDSSDGVEIAHIITVGFNGVGRILDSLLKSYFSEGFEKELNERVQIEFHKLANIIS